VTGGLAIDGAKHMSEKQFQEFSTVKYEISASFEIQGVVEKSDVVGAIFGQTEGLLGDELDIRDLQKSGRIGRINVEMTSEGGITKGKITIPSSLDRVETAILAATIETVDRVGPCMAAFKLESLEDVRKTKRDKIIGRATQLLQKWDMETAPETQEITDKVSQARLLEDIVAYGDEKLPAGPEVDTSDTIIITEGRADILNLLSIGVKNAIATNGTSVPKAVAELSKKKTTIALLDGDRGGDMILNELPRSISWPVPQMARKSRNSRKRTCSRPCNRRYRTSATSPRMQPVSLAALTARNQARTASTIIPQHKATSNRSAASRQSHR
jgi:DNA primase